jgi:predicted acyltransferase
MENGIFAKRNESIDILRGLTMLLMVFVNDLWSVGGVPHFLEHFEVFEDGMGVADIVFPMFLFAMGMSIPYALESRFSKGCSGESTLGHILSRTFALVIMGAFTVNSEGDFYSVLGYGKNVYRLLIVLAFFLVWNNYGKDFKWRRWLQAAGTAILVFLAFTVRTANGGFFNCQWWGILGLIGWAYCFNAVTYLLVRRRPMRVAVVWLSLCLVNLLVTKMHDGTQILAGRSLLTDMAGVLKIGNGAFTLMATGGMLFSLLEDRMTSCGKSRALYAVSAAALLAFAATVLRTWWPVSKLLSTLPWCLYVTAISIALYVLLRSLESRGRTGWFRPLKASGTATLTVYMMPYILYALRGILGISTPEWVSGPVGLLKCALFSLLCVALTSLLVRFRIKLKI